MGNFPLSLVKEKIEQGHLVQLDFKNTKIIYLYLSISSGSKINHYQKQQENLFK